jgi:hypothetical protein
LSIVAEDEELFTFGIERNDESEEDEESGDTDEDDKVESSNIRNSEHQPSSPQGKVLDPKETAAGRTLQGTSIETDDGGLNTDLVWTTNESHASSSEPGDDLGLGATDTLQGQSVAG